MEYPEPLAKQVDIVLHGINQTYPQLKVFLAAKTSQIKNAASKYPNVKTVMAPKDNSLGKVWKQLIDSSVNTIHSCCKRCCSFHVGSPY